MATDEITKSDRTVPNAAITAVVVALVTALAYGATLAWDTEYDVAADGSQTGPYSTLQVAILVVLLVMIVGWAGWRGAPIIGATAATLVLVALWSVQASSAEEPNLWMVGAFMLLIGAFVGLTVAGVIGSALRGRQQHGMPQ